MAIVWRGNLSNQVMGVLLDKNKKFKLDMVKK